MNHRTPGFTRRSHRLAQIELLRQENACVEWPTASRWIGVLTASSPRQPDPGVHTADGRVHRGAGTKFDL